MAKRGEYVGLGGLSGDPAVASLSWFASNPGAKYAALDGSVYYGASAKVLAYCSDQTTWGGFNTVNAFEGTTTNRDGTSTQDGSGPTGAQTNGIVKMMGVNGRRYVFIFNAVSSIYELWTSSTPTSVSWTKCIIPTSVGDASLAEVVYAFGYYWMNAPGGAGTLQRSSDGITFSAFTTGGIKANAIGFVSVCDGALMWSGVDVNAGSTYFVQYSNDGINWITSVASGSAPVQFTHFVKAGSTIYAIALYAGNVGKIYYASSVSSATWTLLTDGSGYWGTGTFIRFAVLGSVFMAWRANGAATSTTTYIWAWTGSTYQGSRTLASVSNSLASSGTVRAINTNVGLLFYTADAATMYWGYVTTWNETPTVLQMSGFSGAPFSAVGTCRNAARCGEDLVFQNSTFINGISATKIGPVLPKVPAFRTKSAYAKVA